MNDLDRRAATLDAVRRAEAALLQMPQIDLRTQQIVHGQVCVRWILIPAGCALTGALTKCDNVCIVYGDIDVTTDDGPRRVVGFEVLPAKAGAKRAGLAYADTWWATVHHTTHTDPAEIDREMTDEHAMLQAPRLGMNHRLALEAP